ncbi:VID27 cytoplasmic protein-domain-containing protein [Roridomyces roridus]|uniref:VID27 cytoplasmic protein-domain-containing protein n=1 Tax=Roridomyces roridus TaxID=1738132 RepID=A0AAD7C506_9AGAR|nr:VID27 cytoplasmic protein-domain-containing protein [Roridomyces roridus]
MNIFKSLIGKVWQDPNAAEVVKIPAGQLYLVRPGNIRTSRECIYNDAIATIRRVSTVEHHFQLVITRVYEDGDQELLEDEDETDEEKTFLIAEELEFRPGETTDGEPTFAWRDLQGDVDEFYEYVALNTNAATRAFFETCMYRAMYERKYKAGADNVSDEQLQEFIWQAPAAPQPARRKKVAEESPKGKGRATEVSPLAHLPVLIVKEADLFFWDPELEHFAEHGPVTAKLLRVSDSTFVSWLTASSSDGDLLTHKITDNMSARWTSKMRSLTWTHTGEDKVPTSWVLRFATSEDYEAFMKAFSQVLWETLYQTAWGKMKPEDQKYVMSASEDVEMPDVSEEEERRRKSNQSLVSLVGPCLFLVTLSPIPADDSDSEEEEDVQEEDEEDRPPPLGKGERNSHLTVGYRGDRSYVVRGSKIGYFTRGSDHQMKYGGTIDGLSYKGTEFKPEQVMLHDQDSKMILKNPGNPHALYSLDLERGKIVDEWKVHDDITVDHMAPQNKFAPTTHEQTLVGASHNALFLIDPRVSGTKMVETQFKQYVSKNKFSGVATTKEGKLAVASEKGDIRLFDSIGKIAKTALPPLGDPITGIDVTADGRYVVATTKTYLLLIDTLIGEGRYAGSLGFDRSFPAAAKPIPRRLQLRNEHISYMNHDISFSPARFNQSETDAENAIVTSTGQFVIAWDFNKVKKGQLDKYEIKKYEDMVVQDNFRFGDDKEIIVALANNVVAVNKQQLKRPTRHSLGVPRRSSRGHSTIVNAPF